MIGTFVKTCVWCGSKIARGESERIDTWVPSRLSIINDHVAGHIHSLVCRDAFLQFAAERAQEAATHIDLLPF